MSGPNNLSTKMTVFIAAVILILAGGALIIFAPNAGLAGSAFVIIGVIVSRFLRRGSQSPLSLTEKQRRMRFFLIVVVTIMGCIGSVFLFHYYHPETDLRLIVVTSAVVTVLLVAQTYSLTFKVNQKKKGQ